MDRKQEDNVPTTNPSPEFPLPPLNLRNYKLTRFFINRLLKNLKVSLRVHHLSDQLWQSGGIVVSNHFTRFETFLLPHILYQHTWKKVRVLAHYSLFQHRFFGDYLKSIGAIPSNTPGKYELIARDILQGGWWLIFPEGGMVKDRKVMEDGKLQIYNDGVRRPPHSGAAVVSLLVQRYKTNVRRALGASPSKLKEICDRLGLAHCTRTDLEEISRRAIRLLPVNVTYYPLRGSERIFHQLLRKLPHDFLSRNGGERLLEEITVEGSMLLQGIDIDIRAGDPFDVETGIYPLNRWRMNPDHYPSMMRVIETLRQGKFFPDGDHSEERWILERAPRVKTQARRTTEFYMKQIYALTTVNLDHLTCEIIRQAALFHGPPVMTVSQLCQTAFSVIEALRRERGIYLHPDLQDPGRVYSLLIEGGNPKFSDLLRRLDQAGLVTLDDQVVRLNAERIRQTPNFDQARLHNVIQVYSNEIQPLPRVIQIVSRQVASGREFTKFELAETLFSGDLQVYEKDWKRFTTDSGEESEFKPRGRGAPFYHPGRRDIRERDTGVLLLHGFSASPEETKPLGRSLHSRGHAVYGVRLRGHGTVPEDLESRTWEEWYDSALWGYSCLHQSCSTIFVVGFSAGAALALLLAARKPKTIRGVVAVSPPIKMQNPWLRLAAFLGMVTEHVASEPENPHINYSSHSLKAISQFNRLVKEYQVEIPRVACSTLIIQSRLDPTVKPESAQIVYDQIRIPEKKLIWIDRPRHVIIGKDCPEVHEEIARFIDDSMPPEGN